MKTHAGALEAQAEAARARGYEPDDETTFCSCTMSTPTSPPKVSRTNAPRLPVVFGSVSDFEAWPTAESGSSRRRRPFLPGRLPAPGRAS